MKQYSVTGMSCAACQTRIEKAVSAVNGVESCAVSLLTNSMGVEGTASSEDVIRAVEAAGYKAVLRNGYENNRASGNDSFLKDTQSPGMIKRLIASVIILIPLLYVSMGGMMGAPLPGFFEHNFAAVGIYEMLLSGLVMVINQKFFINGFKGLVHRSPNMDTLVSLGASASYLYSVYALFSLTGAIVKNDPESEKYFMGQFYFESGAMILTLVTVGKLLETRSKGKTTNALKALMDLAPKTAAVIMDGVEKIIPAEDVRKGDIFAVRPGDSIPVDGIVLKGESTVNEAALTGESMPADKKAGDHVSAATINISGYMECEATRVGEDTTLSEIIRMVGDAAATKAPAAKTADRVSGVFVPAIISLSLLTFFVWLLLGQTVGYSVARAVCVLVISCPCALGLATPVAVMAGNGVGAGSGILFKTAAALEQAGKTQIVVLDKTGTLTTGIMKVTDVIPAKGVSEEELLVTAYSLEAKSEHPVSGAISEYAKEKSVKPADISRFEAVLGKGLKAELDSKNIAGGNAEFISSITGGTHHDILKKIKELAKIGKTPVLFAADGKYLGLIAVSDTVKEDSKKAVNELKQMGMHVIMLTGDNKYTADAVAKAAGVDEFAASLKPDDKEEIIKYLKTKGSVTMVGDGINDAPALTCADLGIAIGAGTDIALDAADIVLMKNSIMDVAAAVRISRATLRNIHENLFWAFFYNSLGIPLAAGCFVSLFGWELSPVFGAAAMGMSSFCVVSNALRLNLVKPYDSKKYHRPKTISDGPLLSVQDLNEEDNENRKEEIVMKISVKGMMCIHCEAHVKKALEAIEGIENVTASHEAATVEFTCSKNVDEAVVKAAVEEAGYEYIGILEQ